MSAPVREPDHAPHDAAMALEIINAVRRATAELIATIDPGGNASNVARRLDIERTLAWRLTRLAAPDRLAEVVLRAPTGRSARKIASSASGVGAPAEVIEAFTASLADFEAWRATHGPQREALARMIERLEADGSEPDGWSGLTSERRELTRAASAIWGVRAAVRFKLDLILPSQTPGRIDIVSAQGYEGLVSYRDDLRWPLASARLSSGTGELRPGEARPILPGAMTASGAPLLPDFCEGNLPEIESRRDADGTVRHVLRSWPLGATSPISLTIGVCIEGVGQRLADAPGEYAEMHASQHTPADAAIQAVFAHRELWPDPAPPALCLVLSELGPLAAYPSDEASRVDLLPRVSVRPRPGSRWAMGAAPSARLEALAGWLCGSRGATPSDFAAYAVSIAYPPIPSRTVIRVPMPC